MRDVCVHPPSRCRPVQLKRNSGHQMSSRSAKAPRTTQEIRLPLGEVFQRLKIVNRAGKVQGHSGCPRLRRSAYPLFARRTQVYPELKVTMLFSYPPGGLNVEETASGGEGMGCGQPQR